MIDTHCHLYQKDFDSDLDLVIKTSLDAGVYQFLVPGVNLETSKLSLKLQKSYSDVFQTAAGIHPSYSEKCENDNISAFLQEKSDQIAAIGEIGLDFYRMNSPIELQKKIFRQMLALAADFRKPVCIHNRDADFDLIDILSEWYPSKGKITGIFHAFSGSELVCEWGISHGFLFGIGGLATYKKSKKLRELIKTIGLDKIVLETDSPYLSPTPMRGKRNTPANLTYIVRTLAELFNTDETSVIDKTDRNAVELLGLKRKMP